MRLPDFIIIGAPKSGTTTLHQYLCQHPQIHMSPAKELEFFARDEVYHQGLEWYGSLFEKAKDHQIVGEYSTIYTSFPYFPETASRMAQAVPNVKLIYLMRHPIDRAYSHYVQLIKRVRTLGYRNEIGLTFDDCVFPSQLSASKQKALEELQMASRLPQVSGSYLLDISHYMMQIEQYLNFFEKNAFLFLFMDDLVKKPVETVQRVLNFIGITQPWESENIIIANSTQKYHDQLVKYHLMKPIYHLPGTKTIKKLLPKTLKESLRNFIFHRILHSKYGQRKKQKLLPLPMTLETRKALVEWFQTPNQRLATFLNEDLSHWQS